MATSDTNVCNLALIRMGSQVQIQDLVSEQSAEAIACRIALPISRRRCLEYLPWPFAQQYATLALVAEEPNTDWGYSYRWPTDALTITKIVNSAGRTIVDEDNNELVFEAGSDASGRLIFTDYEDAVVKYTALVENPNLYSGTFESALAWLLAADLAMALSRDKALKAEMMREYQIEVDMAARIEENSINPDAEPDSAFIRERL